MGRSPLGKENAASLQVIEKLGVRYLGNINPSVWEEPYFAAMVTAADYDSRGRSWSGSPGRPSLQLCRWHHY